MSYGFTCNGCVFQFKENDVQTDCVLERLKKFEESGFKVNKQGRDYRVEGLIGCSSKRDKRWEYTDKSFGEQVQQIVNEHKCEYDLIFYWANDCRILPIEHFYDNLKYRLDEIENLQNPPAKIIVAYDKSYPIKIEKIAKLLETTKIPYGITVAEQVKADGDIVNLAYQNSVSPFMWIVPLDYNVKHDMPALYNKKNNYPEWARYLLVYDHYYNEELFTSTPLFDQLNGCDSLDRDHPNHISCFVDKVKVLVEEQNKSNMIITRTEFYKNEHTD